jgi:hypothetical protein
MMEKTRTRQCNTKQDRGGDKMDERYKIQKGRIHFSLRKKRAGVILVVVIVVVVVVVVVVVAVMVVR